MDYLHSYVLTYVPHHYVYSFVILVITYNDVMYTNRVLAMLKSHGCNTYLDSSDEGVCLQSV